MSRLTNDVDNISSTISNSMTQLLTAVFTIIGILCIMISLNLLLTAVSLLSVLIIFLFTRVITKRTRKMFSSQQKILGKLNGHIEESVSGANVVKAFCQEDEMIAQFDTSNEELRQVSTRALIWSGFLMPITNVLNNLTYVFLSIFSGILAVNGSIEIGMISSFLLYPNNLHVPSSALPIFIITFKQLLQVRSACLKLWMKSRNQRIWNKHYPFKTQRRY
ncbi:MAG: ABC transporter ATP-binding protein [Acutalibacteraceae bacterium]